ncbi:hypothetical protein BT93_A2052 [Corymbia citriodora subsp. variegata]|nr:hypothetical protein BT93_A2052 [Corymbia citriodora subsp. variegata]
MGDSWRQLKVMLRKNWLLKIRHPFVTAAEILLPTIVILLLVAVRTRVDTQIHPAQAYIRKDMLVEIGQGISPNFQQVLELLYLKREFLAFAPDTEETRMMINWMSIKFPLLKHVHKIYKDEEEIETYIRSDIYGTCSQIENCSNPKIREQSYFMVKALVYMTTVYASTIHGFSGFPT